MTETKIIVATFKTNQKETIVYGLWQYDYGQTLRIRGLQIPSVVQVHFALQELDGESVTEIGTTQNGVTDVKIPDGLLKKTTEIDIYDRPVYKMFAWIYFTDGTYGKTEYKIILPIIKRAKPVDYDPDDEVVTKVFDQAVAKVNSAAARAETAANQAAETAAEISVDRKQIQTNAEDITGLKEDLGDTSNELYKKEEREIAVDSSDYNLLENKVAYIDTNNEVMTYENANAYVMHKNVISGEKYRIMSQTHGSVNTLLYAICDSNGKVINSAKMGVSPNTYLTTDITIPDNGVEMYLNEFPTQTYPLVVNKIETINISKINGKETVNCWGDSLTRGVGVGDSYSKAFPYVLHGLLDGRKVINCGVGGENTINIASRQGGLPNIVKPFTIPANASKVEIELTNIYGDSTGILLQGGSALDPTTGKYVMTAQINPCSINGVEGTLTYENGKYYFSRSENGESVIVSRPTPLITYAMKSMRDNINIIWIGTNGGFTTSAELIECIEAMIDYMSPINKKYIVIGVHHLVSTVTETFETIEKNMSIHFGRHFINQRKYMLEYGLSDARITPTAEDITAISQGKIPTSLLYDDVHYNDKGYNIIATLASERGKELGYWQLAKEYNSSVK